MAKFVPMEEAARILGISVDQLIEARENNEIHGYRDGASWKFKDEEVERYKQERASGGTQPSSTGESDLLRVPGLLDDDDESVLVSDDDSGVGSGIGSSIGPAGAKKSSTIIGAVEGKPGDAKRPSDSDLMLAADLGSDVLGGPSSGKSKSAGDSDVELIPADDGSDVKIVPGGSSALLGEHDSELRLDLNTGSTGGGSGELGSGGSDDILGSGGLEDEEDLSLGDDEDLVLSGSGTGSDVTMGGSDTGINLAKPSDSGLLLDDEALDLGSVSSLELPEDEEGFGITDDEPIVKKDEEFLLSPADAGTDDAEETSGSQIIELDPTFTDAVEVTDEGLLEPQEEEALVDKGGEAVYVTRPEIPYSVYNVFFLSVTVVLLFLCGILMLDVVRNMWSWNDATATSPASGIMEGIVNAIGLNE